MDKQMPSDKTETSVANGSAKNIDALPAEKLRYGWFSFTPQCLQWLNVAVAYGTLMSLTNIFLSGTSNGLTGAIQSTIEKRFKFTSQESSLIVVVYEFVSLPVSIFITWLGTVGCHRPRWAAMSMVSAAIGCLTYAMPHFTTGVYRPDGTDDESELHICQNRTGVDPCNNGEVEGDLAAYIWMFIAARCFLAFGGGGLYTLGITFLDDSLTKAKFSLWSSVFAAAGVVGPAIGFIAGGAFLLVYSELTVNPDDIDLDPSDPRWVGAWWLPLVIFGFFLLFFSIPLSGYPSDLPASAEVRANKGSEAFNAKKDAMPEDTTRLDFSAKDIIPFTKDLLTNVTFIFLTLYICCDMSLLSAFTIYGPKYVELMFSLTAADAGMIFGALVVPAGAVGTIVGGVIIDKKKLSIQSIMKLEFAVSIFVICMGPLFLIRCPQVDFAGVNVPYNSTSTDLDLIDSCNADCMCENLRYLPVCSHDSVQYFSPCHAGCNDRVEDDDLGTIYDNCSCIPTPSDPTEPYAKRSICNNPECALIPLFAVMIFFAMAGLFMSEAMNISTIIRCMPNNQRVYGMFLSGIVVRYVGAMPGPVIFASAFDASCILWQDNCDVRGSCFYYDTATLAYYITGICLIVKFASIICMFFAFWLYKPPKIEIMEMEIQCDDTKKIVDFQNDKWKSDVEVTEL